MLLIVDESGPLAISNNEVWLMRALLIDAGVRAVGRPDIEVVREFAKRSNLQEFLRKARALDEQGPSMASPDDYHTLLGGGA